MKNLQSSYCSLGEKEWIHKTEGLHQEMCDMSETGQFAEMNECATLSTSFISYSRKKEK